MQWIGPTWIVADQILDDVEAPVLSITKIGI